jgi:hypothetical protein
MSEPIFDFYFEHAGRSGAQGAIAPAEQFFEGSIAEVSLAREIGQNSLDARAGDGPVLLTFELAEMPTDSVPGIATLRSHLAYVAEETKGSEGNTRMVAALNASKRQTIPVLRISDFGTTGLRGSESKDSNKSALSALTRGAGISANDGTRGGSFGIGSAVGPMSSSLCTVLYTSRPDDRPDVVFAGYSRLASHRDASGAWRQAEGFYTDINRADDFSYQRDPSPIGPFASRSEAGTDILVLGYRKADEDPTLENIRKAFLSHFIVAIHRGRLEIEGIAGGKSWRLTKDNLREHVKGNPEAHAFYLAIQDAAPVTKQSARFGSMSLYINVDDTLERSLHTITVRKPLMKIDTFRHTSIPAKYAAILECSDESGNQLLRALEPPQHDRWDPGRAVDGENALKELKQFVREGLKSRVKDQLGDAVEIKGLSKYLPTQDLRITKDEFGHIPASGGDGSAEEAATVHGKPSQPESAPVSTRRTVKVMVRTTAGANGEADTEKGKDRGGSGERKPSTPSLPGTGGEEDGNARINKGDVRFRSWSDHGTGTLNLALTASEDLFGDVELIAIGAGGAAEDDYILPIAGIDLLDGTGTSPIAWSANVLSGIPLTAGKTTRLRLRLEHGHRYRLDIK